MIGMGCQIHTTKVWSKLTDDEIKSMDSGGVEVWGIWKKAILAAAKAHQSQCKPLVEETTES